MQGGAQTQRTGPDHHDIGVHQAIVPYPACQLARAKRARSVYRARLLAADKPKIDSDGPAAKETLVSGLIGTLVPGACWMIPPGMSTFE